MENIDMEHWGVKVTKNKSKLYKQFILKNGFKSKSAFMTFCMDRMLWPLQVKQVVISNGSKPEQVEITGPEPLDTTVVTPNERQIIDILRGTNGMNVASIATRLNTDVDIVYSALKDLESRQYIKLNRKMEWVLIG
ncbi:MAG: hypothetical protein ACTSUE_13775 [Promethearchaeota archaeon]